MFFVETETLLDYFGGGPATTGLDLGRTGPLLDYMHSGPTGATYLPDLYRLPYPVEDLDRAVHVASLSIYSSQQHIIVYSGRTMMVTTRCR